MPAYKKRLARPVQVRKYIPKERNARGQSREAKLNFIDEFMAKLFRPGGDK